MILFISPKDSFCLFLSNDPLILESFSFRGFDFVSWFLSREKWGESLRSELGFNLYSSYAHTHFIGRGKNQESGMALRSFFDRGVVVEKSCRVRGRLRKLASLRAHTLNGDENVQ